jgi:hypothetical protein
MQATVSCYSCHFEDEIENDTKVAFSTFHEWKFLLKWKGKVHQANVQTLTYGDESFVTIAPFSGHSVYVPDPATICDECHSNAIVDEYNTSGTMTAVWWTGTTLDYFRGVIPVPTDWQTSLKFSFVEKEELGGGNYGDWIFLKDGADLQQMLYGEPLDQMPPQF